MKFLLYAITKYFIQSILTQSMCVRVCHMSAQGTKRDTKNCVPRVSVVQSRDKIVSHNRKETSNKLP